MYGIAAGDELEPRTIAAERIAEDPPSNLAVIGRYVLPPRIFEVLDAPAGRRRRSSSPTRSRCSRERGGAAATASKGRHDAGDRLGYLKANLAFALEAPRSAGCGRASS